MQIDGHHTGTYVAARAAGFPHNEAAKIAYAAQYVDDATNVGSICFKSSEYMYFRIATAHRMIDYQNLIEVANHMVWLPFHFLPGNGGLPAGQNPPDGEVEKLICRPDSHVARDMLRASFADHNKERGLHRLGIAMHVYADTFAHQGFVGAMHKANEVSNLHSDNPGADKQLQDAPIITLLKNALKNIKDFIYFVRGSVKWLLAAVMIMIRERTWPGEYLNDISKAEPLGHIAALAYPDLPYLVWHYTCYNTTTIDRDNPTDYLTAIDMMTRAMRAWRAGDGTMTLEQHDGLNDADRAVVDELLRGLNDPEDEVRHKHWLQAIKAGRFSFGPVELGYVAKGDGSWKHQSLGTDQEQDYGIEQYSYSSAFLSSDWKLFHDAAQVHRSAVVHDILPRYGICAA
jgi:hypothetical protein